MTLPRGPHPEPYIPAVLRDPNSDLQYAPDIPLQLQRVRYLPIYTLNTINNLLEFRLNKDVVLLLL